MFLFFTTATCATVVASVLLLKIILNGIQSQLIVFDGIWDSWSLPWLSCSKSMNNRYSSILFFWTYHLLYLFVILVMMMRPLGLSCVCCLTCCCILHVFGWLKQLVVAPWCINKKQSSCC